MPIAPTNPQTIATCKEINVDMTKGNTKTNQPLFDRKSKILSKNSTSVKDYTLLKAYSVLINVTKSKGNYFDIRFGVCVGLVF